MDKMDPPRTFGVFKPAGHTVVAFPHEAMLAQAKQDEQSHGLQEQRFTLYTPQEMLQQCNSDVADAGAFAQIGQELNLVKLHRELALDGCYFMVVETATDDDARQVADISRTLGALIAQQYGRFTIEDLIDPANGKAQVFESPDRGIDSKLSSHSDKV